MKRAVIGLAALGALLLGEYAGTARAAADGDDPVKAGIMQGYPLPADRQVTLQNWLQFPLNRWAFRNMRALFPTGAVVRGGAVAMLG